MELIERDKEFGNVLFIDELRVYKWLVIFFLQNRMSDSNFSMERLPGFDTTEYFQCFLITIL